MDDETKSHAAKLTARTACTVTSLAAHRQPSEMHWLRRLERGVR